MSATVIKHYSVEQYVILTRLIVPRVFEGSEADRFHYILCSAVNGFVQIFICRLPAV